MERLCFKSICIGATKFVIKDSEVEGDVNVEKEDFFIFISPMKITS